MCGVGVRQRWADAGHFHHGHSNHLHKRSNYCVARVRQDPARQLSFNTAWGRCGHLFCRVAGLEPGGLRFRKGAVTYSCYRPAQRQGTLGRAGSQSLCHGTGVFTRRQALASAGGFSESDIRLWDAASGKEIGKLEGHGSWVSSLVFSADGKQLTSSSADQTIRTWDIASEKCLDVLRGHRQEVWRLAMLPNDKTVISGAKDGAVCFWDTSVTHPHQPHATLTLPKDIILCAFAADSQSILMVEAQGQVSRWTAPDFQEKAPLLRMDSNILSCHFSSDGRFMACCRANGVLQVWDASQRVLLHQLTNAAGYENPVACFSDGKKLVTYSASDRLLHELDLTTGLEIQSWQAPPNS